MQSVHHKMEFAPMESYRGTCPLSQQQLLDEYFMQHRNQLLEIAAFLDRLDRAASADAVADVRLRAFRNALDLLRADAPNRVEQVQMMLSDPTTELLSERDQQNALGAYRKES
jgi:hypothetical protein